MVSKDKTDKSNCKTRKSTGKKIQKDQLLKKNWKEEKPNKILLLRDNLNYILMTFVTNFTKKGEDNLSKMKGW